MLLADRKVRAMKRTYTDQNPREVEFLAKIGDREMTKEEVKELQKIRQYARQNAWKKKSQDRFGLFLPKGYRAKVDTILQEQVLDITTFFRMAIDHVWTNSTAYKAILTLYNTLDLSSDNIDADLASERLILAKINGKSAWIYEDKSGIYSDGSRLLSQDEIKALD